MRRILPLLLFALFVSGATAANVEFVRVWAQWQNADAFERIGEYFGRSEDDGRETVIRTHPEQRAGLYFLVRTKAAAEVSAAKFVLEIIRPDSPDPKSYTFPASISAKAKVFLLGLTGNDWPGGHEAHPVAWKLSLIDAQNQPLATQQSFLWALPETASAK